MNENTFARRLTNESAAQDWESSSPPPKASQYPSRCPVCGRGGEPGPWNGAPEPLLTLTALAEALGVPVSAIRRAANRGDFRIYRVGNGHARARLTEVLAAIEGGK